MLVTQPDGNFDADHLPFEFDPGVGPLGTLTAHVARNNPLWQRSASSACPLSPRTIAAPSRSRASLFWLSLDLPTSDVMLTSRPTMLRSIPSMYSGAESDIFHGLGSAASCRRVRRATRPRTKRSSSRTVSVPCACTTS
jgi:hypothetical protein